MNVQQFLKGFHPTPSGDYVLDVTTLDLAGVNQLGTLYLGGTTWTVHGAVCAPATMTVNGTLALPGSAQPLTARLSFLVSAGAIVGVVVRLAAASLNLQTAYVHWNLAQSAPSLPMKTANLGFTADATTVSSRLGFSLAMVRTPAPLLLDLWAEGDTPQDLAGASMLDFSLDSSPWPDGPDLGRTNALQELAPNARFDGFPSIIPLKTCSLQSLQIMGWIREPSGLPVLETLMANVQIARAFTVIDRFFDIDTLNAMMLMPDLSGDRVYYSLGGAFDLGHLLGTPSPEKFGMTLEWDPAEQARLKARGAPGTSVPVVFTAGILTPIDLAPVLKKCLGIDDLGPLKALAIDGLTTQGNLADGSFQLDIGLTGSLHLLGKVEVDGLNLCVRRNADKTWSGLITANFDLGGYTMSLGATYDQGWSFFGTLGQQRTAPPSIGQFFQNFGTVFGVSVPDGIGSMTRLTGMTFVADLGDAPSVTVTLEGQTELCGRLVKLVATAALGHQNAFSGILFLADPAGQAGAQLQVTYDDHTFTGTWINRSPNPYSFADIMGWFGLDALDDLPVLIPDTLAMEHTPLGVGVTLGLGAMQGGLARLTPATGQPAAWMAVLQVDLGLTFSRTPLASGGMPPDQDFGLPNAALAYANAACAALPPEAMAALVALMPAPPQGGMNAPGLPAGGLVSGLTLDPTVQPAGLMGNPFNLPQNAPTTLWEVVNEAPVRRGAGTPAGERDLVRTPHRSRAPRFRTHPLVTGPGGLFVWLPVNKSLGPVTIGRVGIGYQNGRVALGIDAGFSIAGFSLEFMGLTLSHDFKPDVDLEVGLQGLSVGYDDGAIEVEGQFLQVPGPNGTEYIGDVTLTMLDLTVAVQGAYGKVKTPDGGEAASLFIFGLMGEPMGGAPWCFVTGLAAGAGINRALQMPSLQDLPQFPLVAAAIDPAGPSNPFAPGVSPDQALAVMESVLPPVYGNKWFALGVRFSSFGLLESFVLMTASFGARTQIGLMGVTAMTLPRGAPDPIAYAELAIEATLDPSAGTLTVNGQLTPQSYVISPACQLQGGFGFAAWFKDQTVTSGGVTGHISAGDFALVLGGYHPLFNPPSYYPKPQMVTANWQLDEHMSITGSFYFALTPGALMAGGGLNAVWESSGLRAWFNESADFLLGWRPFRYAADLSLSLGVSYTLDLLFTSVTIGVSLGVSVSLAGPPLHGDVEVDLYVVSFTISFGNDDDRSEQAPIAWDDFKKTLLPSDVTPPALRATSRGPGDATPPPPTPTDSMCRARVARGLAQDLPASKHRPSGPLDPEASSSPSAHGAPVPQPDWLFTGHDFEVSTESVFASTALSQGGTTVAPTWAQTIEAGPAGARQGAYAATHAITWVDDEGVDQAAPGGLVQVSPTLQALPLANWNVDAALSPTADHLNQRFIADGLVGTRLTPTPRTYDQLPSPVALALLQSERSVPPQPLSPGSGFAMPTATFLQTKDQFDTIASPAAQAARNAIVALARLDGSPVQPTGVLRLLGDDVYLTQQPRIVAAGAG